MKRPITRPLLLSSKASLDWFDGTLSVAELDQRWHAGQLPLDLADSMSVGEAAGVAATLPAVRGDHGAPVGYGVAPPQGAQPIARLAKHQTDLFGEPVARGAKGVIGMLWRSANRTGRLVFRLWFRAEMGHGFRPAATPTHIQGAFRIVDAYDDAIACIVGIEGIAAHTTGWQIVRLDQDIELQAAREAVAATGSRTVQRLFGANGKPVGGEL